MDFQLYFVIILVALPLCWAADYPNFYVSALHGKDTNSGLDAQSPLQNIGTAFAKVDKTAGGVIIVMPGIYYGDKNCGLKLDGYSYVSLMAYDTESLPTINCNKQGWHGNDEHFYVTNSNIIVDGFILEKALHNTMYCIANSNCTLQNSVIRNNGNSNSFAIYLTRGGHSMTANNITTYLMQAEALKSDTGGAIVNINDVVVYSQPKCISIISAAETTISNVECRAISNSPFYFATITNVASVRNIFVGGSSIYGMRFIKATVSLTNVVIDGVLSDSAYSAVQVEQNSLVTFDNATIINCAGSKGAVGVISGASAKIQNSNIMHNGGYGPSSGGAFYVNGGSLQLFASQVSDNQAVDGGAIYCNSGSLTLFQSTLTSNYATNDGGVQCNNCPSVTCFGSTIDNNVSFNSTSTRCNASC